MANSDPSAAGLPAISSLFCANGVVQVTLGFAPDQPITAGLFKSLVSGTPLATGTSAGVGVAIFTTTPFDPTAVYYVALSADPASGAWGPATPVVWQQPTLAAAIVAPGLVELSWTVPATTTIDGVRASLYDETAYVRISTGVFAGTGTRLIPPIPLAASARVSISLIGVNGVSSGPEVKTPVFFTSPTVTSVSYGVASGGGYTVTAAVDASTAPSGGTVLGQLLRDGVVVQQQAASGGAVAFSQSRPLDPGSEWSVVARYQVGAVLGPAGFPVRVAVPDVPAIAALFYSGGALVVNLASSAAPSATVALFKGSPSGKSWIASADTSGGSAMLMVDPSTLEPAWQYVVALTRDPNATPVVWGPATTLVWQQPTLGAVVASAAAVDVGWTLPVQTTIQTVSAALFDRTHGVRVANAQFAGTSGRLQLAIPLDPAGSYAVELTGGNGVASSSPVASAALILDAPKVESAVYQPAPSAAGYQVVIAAAARENPPGAVVGWLLADGLPVARQAASGATVTFSLVDALDPASRWQVALSYQSGAITGPAGVAAELPLAAASLEEARFDGTAFHLSWRNLGEACGAQATISRAADGAVVATATVGAGTSATLTPGGTIDPAKGYQATLAPIRGSARGLAGPAVPLIVAAPALASASTDGAQVLVDLTGGDPAATEAELWIEAADGSCLCVVPAGPSGGYAALPGGVTGIRVAARSIRGPAIGPTSPATPVILTAPALSQIAFTGSAVTGKATAPAGVALDTPVLTVALLADDLPVGTPVSATSDGSFSIPCGAPREASLTLRTWLSGTTSSVAVAGPHSPAYPVLSNAPAITTAVLARAGSAWQLTAAWAPPAGAPVALYTVTAAQKGASLGSWQVAGTSLRQTIATVGATDPVTLAVTPQGAYGQGPASSPATFLPAAVGALSARVDGPRISAQWAAGTSSPPATAFRLRLVQASGGAWASLAEGEVVTGTASALSAPAGLDPAGSYGLAVDAALGEAWIQLVAVAPLPVSGPQITSAAGVVAAGARRVSLSWSAPALPAGTITGYQPMVQVDGQEVALAQLPATPLAATVDLPDAIPGCATIALRALVAAVVGPAGEGVPLLLEPQPSPWVTYDGAQVAATWPAAADPRVSGWAVTFSVSGQTPVVERVQGTRWQRAFTPASDQTATVAIAALGGLAAGPTSAAVPLILHAPAIDRAAFGEERLQLGWTGVTDTAASRTRISIASGGVQVRQVEVGGSEAVIPFEGGPSAVQLQAAGDQTIGPASPAWTPIEARPEMNSASFSPVDGSLTLGWSAAAGAGGYRLTASVPGSSPVVKLTGQATLSLAAGELPAGSGALEVSVLPTGSATSDAFSGPASTPVRVLRIAPARVAVRWNGRSLETCWEQVASPEVVGYQVTVLDGSRVVASQASAAPSVSLALAYAGTGSYQVVVQAVTRLGAGPPSVAVPAFAAGWYPSASTSSAAAILPAVNQGMGAHDIVLYLPNVFTVYVTSGLPQVPPFVMATSAVQPFGYTLTLGATSAVWSFDSSAIRGPVQSAYASFLNALVPLGLTPIGWRVIQDAIARAMPQTFAETLLYGHGFDPANGWVDLRPGMTLRAEYQSYQTLGSDQPSKKYLDGYVASNAAEYQIGSYLSGAAWLTGFDAFLSALTQQGTTVPAPSTDGSSSSGGGGVVDLYFAQLRRQPFLRLVYPPQVLQDGASDPRAAFNVAVLGASDYPTLQSATQNLRNARPLPTGAVATYLRGRTTLSAGIRVLVDGAPWSVPLGTTVGNVLEALASRPPICAPIGTGASGGLPLSGLTFQRATGCAVTDPAVATAGYPVGGGSPIRLDWGQGMAYGSTSDWLGLPLLAGDRITTRGEG